MVQVRFVLAAFVLILVPATGLAGPFPSVDAGQLQAILAAPGGPVLLDVRTPAEFQKGHIPGALLVPVDELASRLEELRPFETRGVVTYCERGGRATRALEILADAGFSNLRLLRGHMPAWRAREASADSR